MMNPENQITAEKVLSPETGEEQMDLNTGIYARTSTTGQEFGYSIDGQVQKCRSYCESMGWEVKFVFVDESESGRNTDREGLQRLMRVAEQGLIDIVVFWRLDRFCRSLVDLTRIQERLEENDVALQSATEYLDTVSAVGKFNFRNLASAAELESDLISQRVQLGMQGLAQENRWPNSDPPMGYNLDEDQRLVIDEREASLVRRIFRWYLRLRSMPEVAGMLNEEGYRTKAGEEWCTQSVQKVLSNKIYSGEYSVAGHQEYVEAFQIVSEAMFDAVAETRFRFKGMEMDRDRKAAKADRVLDAFEQFGGDEQ